MAFDPIWEQIHQERQWGSYPKEELVRWVARNYYESKRDKVSFLDLGCGSGASTKYLQNEGFEVTPVDGSEAAIKRLGFGVVADAVNLPFEDKSFDCIVDIACIAHNVWKDAGKIVAECARVLKPAGRIFSVMPSADCSKEPYKGKGNVIFPNRYQVLQLFAFHFETHLNWSAYSDGKIVVEHWLIDGIVKGD